MNRLNWEQVTAVAALIVALGALVFSVMESRRSENFTRLAAMPAISITYARSTEDVFSFSVINRSDDHAIVKWAAMFFDGQMIESYDDIYAKVDVDRSRSSFRMLWPETYLGADLEFPLFQNADPVAARELVRAIPKISMQLCFCSIFGDCKLLHFNRRDLPEADTCEAGTVYGQKMRMPPSFSAS